MHPPPSDNYRLIKNQINGTDIRKPKSVHPSRRKSSFHSAMVAPKSEPLRRKVMHGGNFELYASREALCASTMDLRLPPRFEAPPPPPLSRDEETRMKKNQVHASRNSLYKEGSNGNQEYSEYGELRAIVRRIEEQKLNHLSRNNTFVSRNQSFSTGKSPHLNRKRMYFDYVPSSVMRSNSHHGGQGPPRPNNLGVPSQSTQTLPHPGSLTMNNSNLSPRHPHHHNNPLIRHPDHFSPDRSSGSSHFPGVSPDSSGTLLNSRLDDSNTASNSPSSSMDNRKGRRNSHKASTQSSSLLIKRSEDAPVTLKGWLYKQGSDGLMLWKKRWFVLSEYCLFYYRSPEEDKVSGSILLPSYKISPVAKEDAVFRRFCFKAEHQNMRTYYFATDTKEAMIQWMNALSLASIMQTPSTGSSSANTTTTPTSPNVTMNGNHLAQSRSSVAVMNNLRTPVTHHQYPTQVHQMYSPNGNAYQYQGESSPASPTSPEGLENGRQPLYANAPPKPRRLTNTREDSPDRFEDEELSPAYHQQMYSRQNPGKVPLRSHTPGERMMYPQAQHYPYQQATHVQNLQQQQRHTQTPGEPIYNGNNINHEVASHNRQGGPTIRHRLPQERRTPEAYGRSHFNMMNQNMSQNYEDVFRNRNNPGYPPPQGRNYPPPPVPQQQSQLPPLPQQHPMFQGYQYPQHQVPHQPYHPQQAQPVTPPYHPPEPPRQRIPRETQRPSGQPQQKVPRPHSADFLELDRNVVAVPTQSSGANNPTNPNQYQSQTQTPHHYMGNHVRRKQNPQPPRPKSSVDPRMFDSSWSTEHYAEQMRNHAPAYAMGTPQQTPRSQSRASIHSKSHLMQDNHVQSQPRTPQTRLYPPQTSQTSDSQVDSSEEVSRYFPTPSPRKPVQVSTTYQNLPDNSTIVTRQYPQYQARLETVTPNRLSEQYQGNNGSDSGTGEFRRSASARLHRNKKNYPEMLNNSDLGPEDSKKKEQREESMKRLLEWKQRMLQSPLTRKSSRNASRTQTPTNSNSPVPSLGHDTQFRQKVLDELEKQSGKSSTPGNSSSNTTGERRLSRKGSGASRSSRSRSSPRIANRPNTSSSDEEYVEANINNNTPLRVRQQTGPPPGRRRTSSASRKDSDTLKQKVRGNLLDITAQDLLGKSHEELVLMLIHLRRQGAALKEAIDSTKAEMQSVAHHPNDTDENQKLHQDLICHIRELEDQHARAHPVITLVDNMVKLGSLYRGPADAPLSHRIRNLPTSSSSSSGVSSSYDSKSQRKTPFDDDKVKMAEQEKAVVQETLESSLEQTKQTIPNGSEEFDAFNKEQEMLENELRRVHGQLQTSQKKLDENSSEHSRWEHDILFLRQTLQQSVTRNMQYGISQSAETLAIEGELAQVQQRASELHRERQSLMTDIQKLSSRQDYLAHEYRSNSSAADKNVANKSKPVESEPKNYEDVHTATPKLTPEKESSEMMELTLGDISEADDRVKKFYGIIPKDNKAAEIKTVRMVKRDSKERSVIKSSRSYVDENGRLIEVEMDDGETPMTTPPMLPRGNYGPNMHDFLQTSTNGNETPKKRGEIFSSGSLPRNYESSSSAESSGNFTNSPAGKALISQVNGTSASTTAVNGGLYSKPNFKLGEYNRKKSKDSSERPASGLSAHERLFGSSRESSMSPPMSPLKNSVLTGSSDSGVSPIMSPIFKSATAKQIAEEVGKHGPPGGTKYRRKSKKRSHTITSGNPAIMEALNNHDAKQSTNRSRDDMDMERILRPRTNAPDVIKSALDKKDMKINSTTIDNLFGVPEKIVIPERYIPDTDMDNITQEERQVRLKKADSIRRMLADTGAAPVLGGLTPKQKENLEDEKKEREHILALNQVLARQVMEKSRIVAGRKLSP